MNDQHSLHFYASSPETCGYLPDRQSISAFANPYMEMNMETYNELIQFGFRRSGGYLYRPHCPGCSECISLRIVTNQFLLSRNDRRCLKQNEDVSVTLRDGQFSCEHFELYRQYINHRHQGSSMQNPTSDDYRRFLICDWTDSWFIEFRSEGRLLGVAVTDITSSGLSAVYTFFDPQCPKRSLGHFAILKQIELCRTEQLPYLYLGYWIRDCQKMAYKARYRPAQGFNGDNWVNIDPLLQQSLCA